MVAIYCSSRGPSSVRELWWIASFVRTEVLHDRFCWEKSQLPALLPLGRLCAPAGHVGCWLAGCGGSTRFRLMGTVLLLVFCYELAVEFVRSLTSMRDLSSVSDELLFLWGDAVILNGKWGFCLLSLTVSPKSSFLYSHSEGCRVACHLSCISFTFRLRVASSVQVFLPGSSVLAS